MRTLHALHSTVACLCVLGLLGVGRTVVAAPPAIVVGEPFPDIALPTLEGRPGTTMSVSRLRGAKVVLHVFASW